MVIGIPGQARLPTVSRALTTVVLAGRALVELLSTPVWVIDLSAVKAKMLLKEAASVAVYQGTSQYQYAGTEVLGVPSVKISKESTNGLQMPV